MLNARMKLLIGRIAVCGAFTSAVALATPAAFGANIVGIAKTARTLYPNMVGYNSDYYYATNPWSDANRLQAAVKSRPALLRYPGGTSANYWDAYHSRLFHDVPKIDTADADPAAWTQTRYTINWLHNAFFWSNITPLSDFRRLYTTLHHAGAAGTEVIFVANMVTPGPDFYTLKWGRTVDNAPGSNDWFTMLGSRYGSFQYMLSDASKNGIPIKYVELGNEYYFGAGLTHKDQPADVEPYVAGSFDADNKYAPENVGTFPDKSDSGKAALYLYSVAANDWASKIKRAYPGTKVCAVGAFLDKEGYGSRTANWNQEALSALNPAKVDAVSLHLYGGPQVGSLTGTEENFGRALKSWQAFWIAGRRRSHLPAKLDFWITEFNIHDEFGKGDNLPENKGTWGNGMGNLYCLQYWLANESRVKVTLLHELARVIEGNGPNIHAHGRAYGLFADAITGRTRARAIEFDDVPNLQGSAGTIQGVAGWAFDTPDHSKPITYTLVNFTGSPQTIKKVNYLPEAANARYAQASAPLDATADPGETTGTLRANVLTLPPYSITVIKSIIKQPHARLLGKRPESNYG